MGAACSMLRVSDIDDACDISARYILFSNCVVQVMRVWSLPVLLIASGEATYTLRRHAADGVPHFARSLWGPWYKIPCAYIWMPFQLRRLLVSFGIDLPVVSVHGAGAYDATASPACNQTQHHTFYGYIRLGSAVYPL